MLLLPFQTLLEEKEVVEDVHAKGDPENLPEGAIDFEVAKIASENLTTSNGLDVAEAIPREPTDDTDQAGETEV
jgi:hypothetical protein